VAAKNHFCRLGVNQFLPERSGKIINVGDSFSGSVNRNAASLISLVNFLLMRVYELSD
jgi:hypothetical protein